MYVVAFSHPLPLCDYAEPKSFECSRQAAAAGGRTVRVGSLLTEATASEAQLALPYLVWPKEAPDPRGWSTSGCVAKGEPGTGVDGCG